MVADIINPANPGTKNDKERLLSADKRDSSIGQTFDAMLGEPPSGWALLPDTLTPDARTHTRSMLHRSQIMVPVQSSMRWVRVQPATLRPDRME